MSKKILLILSPIALSTCIHYRTQQLADTQKYFLNELWLTDWKFLKHQCFHYPQEAQNRSLEAILKETNFPSKFLKQY